MTVLSRWQQYTRARSPRFQCLWSFLGSLHVLDLTIILFIITPLRLQINKYKRVLSISISLRLFDSLDGILISWRIIDVLMVDSSLLCPQPVHLHGSLGREAATGRGAVFATQEMLNYMDDGKLSNKSIVIQVGVDGVMAGKLELCPVWILQHCIQRCSTK